MTQLEADTYKQSRCWDYKMASKTKRKKWEEVKNLKKKDKRRKLILFDVMVGVKSSRNFV